MITNTQPLPLNEAPESSSRPSFTPQAPAKVEDTGLDRSLLNELVLKLSSTTYSFTTEWAAERLHLPVQIVEDLLHELVDEAFLEILGEESPFTHRYTASGRGRAEAARAMEVCSYVGAAPVPLELYHEQLEAQIQSFPELKPREVASVCNQLVVEENVVRVAGLAVSSGRSLFLFGPPGSGKTTLGRLLHSCLPGDLWIPRCLAVDKSIVRLYDPLCHELVDDDSEMLWSQDKRWVRIRRPLVVVGGELTMETLDLSFHAKTGVYEAPLHVKANGGLFLIDDLGRQRVAAKDLLNRWIVPLEYGVDHLTLRTGQQIQVPFRPLLVVATNLEPRQVADSAFLRRMGYRAHLDTPNDGRFIEIFERYAKRLDLEIPTGLLAALVTRYKAERRPMRCCDPRDLLERVVDVCRFHEREPVLTESTIDIAWRGYFSDTTT